MQEAGEGKRGREPEEPSGPRAGVQAREGDQLERGLRERKPERLVPPPDPPPREPAVQHVRVAAPGVQVHPGCSARADEVGAEDATKEEGREAEGGLEGLFDQVLAYGEAVEAEEDGGAGQ